MKKLFKRLLKIVCILAAITLIGILTCHWVIVGNAKGKVYNNVNEVPYREYGLLLGTSPEARFGGVNSYFVYRIEATAKLYKAGKIKYILISGDNNSMGYDEPKFMKSALLKQGVPEEAILCDGKGFRTLDSVVRAKEVFGLKNYTVISQEFHNERAIYLAETYGIDAIGFNAQKASTKFAIIVSLREYLARVKVFVDIVTGKQP